MSQTYKFHMEMTCGGCVGAAERVLGKLGAAVEKVDADLETKTVTVTTTLSQQEILDQLKKTGKEITPK